MHLELQKTKNYLELLYIQRLIYAELFPSAVDKFINYLKELK
jgi:hypothetical protein